MSSKTLAWFAPLLDPQSPLFNNFETFLKKSMPPLEIWTKNVCLTSKYDLFVKNHIKL